MPKKGKVAEPGLVLIAPGIGDIKIPPFQSATMYQQLDTYFFQ